MKATQLCSLYRKDEAADPDAFIAGYAAIFSDYPQDIVVLACDPRTGIPAKHKYLPNMAEVKEFLDGIMAKAAAEEERRRREAERLREQATPEYREWSRKYAKYHSRARATLEDRANVFCAESNTEFYSLLFARHIEAGGIDSKESYCGPRRYSHSYKGDTFDANEIGLWVPLQWVEDARRRRMAGTSPGMTDRPPAREIDPEVPMDSSPPLEAYADALSVPDAEG